MYYVKDIDNRRIHWFCFLYDVQAKCREIPNHLTGWKTHSECRGKHDGLVESY